MWVRGLAALLLSVALGGCSAVVEPSKDQLGARPAFCTPASCFSPCPCPGAKSGRQVCNDRGSFDSCVCGGQAMSVGTILCEGDTVAAPAGSGG